MLTGRRRFPNGVELRPDYHLPRGFPNHTAWDAVLQGCLAMAPHERFPLAAGLRTALIPALRACGTGSAPMLGNR